VKVSLRRGTVRIGAVGRPTEEGPLPIRDVTFRIDDATFPVDRVTFPNDDVTFPIDGVTTPSRRPFFTFRNCSVLQRFGDFSNGPLHEQGIQELGGHDPGGAGRLVGAHHVHGALVKAATVIPIRRGRPLCRQCAGDWSAPVTFTVK
jgi:hypothetical protein